LGLLYFATGLHFFATGLLFFKIHVWTANSCWFRDATKTCSRICVQILERLVYARPAEAMGMAATLKAERGRKEMGLQKWVCKKGLQK
jgi:hypothetical protein